MRVRLFAIGVLFLLAPFASAPAGAGALDDGLAAMDRGAYGEAVAILTPLAEGGAGIAQWSLGVVYAYGLGVPRDLSAAAAWYGMAAAQGFVADAVRLGMLGYLEPWVADSPLEQSRWQRMAIEQGHVLAQWSLVSLSVGGGGLPLTDVEAAAWFQTAAEQGFSEAQYVLGALHAAGTGVTRSLAQSYAWFTVAAARGNYAGEMARDLVEARLAPQGLVEARALADRYLRQYTLRIPGNIQR
jgi:TPR repeat protein